MRLGVLLLGLGSKSCPRLFDVGYARLYVVESSRLVFGEQIISPRRRRTWYLHTMGSDPGVRELVGC
jgi:hypothetical protein